MKIFLIVSFSTLTMWSTLACDFSNPHSLSCQKQTFNGNIFPLESLDFRFLNLRWIPSQFTSIDRRHPIQFRTLKARSARHRTCGVLNPSGREMGDLNVRTSYRGVEAVSIFSFLDFNFITDSRPYHEDAFTFVFGNYRVGDVFRCRVFDRINIPHLTCQYYRRNRLVGYLGFLPHAESCE